MAQRVAGASRHHGSSLSGSLLVTALLMWSTLGCGTTELPENEALGQQSQALVGLNGLGTNGLGTNGLGTNGLASDSFSSWLEEDPATRSELMKYLIRCAIPDGETRTFTSASTGERYTWPGKMGLAPRWGAGQPATEAEEQIVSACLAAHVNPYQEHVVFSLLGKTAEDVELPYTWQELADYNVRESCFFGNLFRDQGLYAGNDGMPLDASHSSLRGCGLSSLQSGRNPVCEPIARVGSCNAAQCKLHSSGLYYEWCSHGGVSYRPLTTRVDSSILYACGDGVCQMTESCGTGRTADNCGLDCGACR